MENNKANEGINKLTRTEWDLSPLAAGDDDARFADDRKVIEKRITAFAEKWRSSTAYLTDPAALNDALDEYEDIFANVGVSGREGYYFHLRTAQDSDNASLKAKENKVTEFSKRMANLVRFFELNIAKIDPANQQIFLGYEGLAPYRHFLEKLFAETKYRLSEAEEKILALKQEPAYAKWVDMLEGFFAKETRSVHLENGERSEKSFSEIMSLLDSKDKAVRDGAACAFNGILQKYADVAEAEMNAILYNEKVDHDLRGIARPDAARHLADDIPTEVVDVLVGAVSSRFDISQRYYRLKADLMGLTKLAYHERNIPFGNMDKKYPAEDAVQMVYRALHALDPEFGGIFASFAENGQLDVFPHKGKRGGAFCAHDLLVLPTYILLNHTNDLRDVCTLAHETGHGINNELMRKKQNALNFGGTMATAEVASTFMEDFVLQDLLRDANDEMRLAIMMKKLNDEISTIFRQVAAYRFEQELHGSFREKGYLSKEDIGSIFQRHMASYMGGAVEQSAGSENWWEYWNHFRSFFYVYSYAGGLLISKSLQRSVKDDPQFVGKVKEFLAAGSSDSPKNIFASLGIDIGDPAFWTNGLHEVELLLTETENLAKKLGKSTG